MVDHPRSVRSRYSSRWFFVLLLSVAVPACGADSNMENADVAMEVLAGPAPSGRFGRLYWIRASDRDPRLWDRAVEFCEGKDERQYPNCGFVEVAAAIKRGEDPPVDSMSLMMEPLDSIEPPRRTPH